MDKKPSMSCTIIGSLCKEIQYIKSRSTSINKSLANCQSNSLIKRLKKELITLTKRQESIQNITEAMSKKDSLDKLSIEFSTEVINRNLILH